MIQSAGALVFLDPTLATHTAEPRHPGAEVLQLQSSAGGGDERASSAFEGLELGSCGGLDQGKLVLAANPSPNLSTGVTAATPAPAEGAKKVRTATTSTARKAR